MLVLLKNHLNYLKHGMFEFFLKIITDIYLFIFFNYLLSFEE